MYKRQTIRGVGLTDTVEDWTQDQLVAEMSTTAKVVKVDISLLFTNTNGNGKWAQASGSTTSSAAPFVFDFFGGGLQFVVGKNTGGSFTYSTIQSAIDAAETIGESAAIIVEPGTYAETVTILKPNISIFATGEKESITVLINTITITLDADGNVALSGLKIEDRLIINGTFETRLLVNDCEIDNGTSAGSSGNITISNSNTDSILVMENCTTVYTTGDGTPSINRSSGPMSVLLNNCVIETDMRFFGGSGSGTLTMNGSAVTNGKIFLARVMVVNINNCNLSDVNALIDMNTNFVRAKVSASRRTTGGLQSPVFFDASAGAVVSFMVLFVFALRKGSQ